MQPGGTVGSKRATLSSMQPFFTDETVHQCAHAVSGGWIYRLAPGLSDGVTNPSIIGCHLGHDRPNRPTTELPNNTGQLLYVAESRFIWSHAPKSLFFLSRNSKDIGSRGYLYRTGYESGEWELLGRSPKSLPINCCLLSQFLPDYPEPPEIWRCPLSTPRAPRDMAMSPFHS
jgi:hypothetical protein